MQQFKVGEDGIKKFRKRWFAIMIPLILLVLVFVTVMNSISTKGGEFNTLPFIVPILAIYFGFSFYRSLKKQKKMLLNYSVTISDEGITREQLNTPPLSISFMEIREIIKTKKGSFMIKGIDKTDVIIIPYWIDNPEVLEQRLQALAPVTVNPKEIFYRKYGPLLLFLVGLGMMIGANTLKNKILAGICGAALTGLLIWLFYAIRRNKNLPDNVKRASWVILIIVASIIGATLFHFIDITPPPRS